MASIGDVLRACLDEVRISDSNKQELKQAITDFEAAHYRASAALVPSDIEAAVKSALIKLLYGDGHG